MTLQIGQVLINRYRIVELVGQGGFGAVYRAWDMSLKVPVAVKENLDTSVEAQRQFEHEAQLLAPLRHPNLPRVGDHFFLPDQGQYLVMDFVEGQSLDALLAERGRPLGEAEALGWIGQVCDALDYLHTRTPPIIHRDIKPQNIIITAEGRAILVDFGISKVYDPTLTTTRGARAVTPGFSPPEQYGMGKTDARSDVYALGATLYALLTGAPPPESVALIAGGEALTPIRRVNSSVNPATEAAVAAAMALASSRRLSGAGAMKAALQGQAIAPLAPVGRTATLAPAAGERRGAPGWLMALAGVVAVGLLAIGAFFLFRPDGGQEAATAEPQGTILADGAAAAPPTNGTPVEEPVAAQLPEDTGTAAMENTRTPEATTAPAVSPTALTEPAATQPAEAPGPGDRRVVTLPSGMESAQVLVPAGSFLMGADNELSEDDEAPIHEVQLDAFYIDETEVTNAQFATFLNAEGLDNGLYESWIDEADDEILLGLLGDGFEPLPEFGNHPVIEVTWNGANAYCAWAGGRLPTEAEWEYAARGPEGNIYPWGDVFECGRLNADDETILDDYVGPGGAGCDGFNRTAPVGNFPQGKSWVGAFDMSGNVWEWVNDWYQVDYYALSPDVNPPGPVSNSDNLKVVRGGSWFKGYISDRGSFREHNQTTETLNDVGFRCVYDVSASTALPSAAPAGAPTSSPSPVAGATRVVTDPSGDENTSVYVPPGSFLMGSEDGNSDERPPHNVTLHDFWLDQTEVSNARFAAFVADTDYQTTAEAQGWGYLFDGGNWDVVNGADWQHPQGPGSDLDGWDDHPVVLVNRADAAAFCDWAGGRLPTEAEWEYAARGPENRLWAWGNEFLTDRVNYCDHDCSASWVDLDVDDGYTYTAPVDSYPDGASWAGALNMTGNVWEWVADWYAEDYYADSPTTNPPGPEIGERGILRGGSWVFEPRRVRTTDRNSTDPTYAINDFGIRCAYDAGGSGTP